MNWKYCITLLDKLYQNHQETYEELYEDLDHNKLTHLLSNECKPLEKYYKKDKVKFLDLFNSVYIQNTTKHKKQPRKLDLIGLIITASGVFFAGYQVYYHNTYNKNKDTVDEMMRWTTETTTRKTIVDNIKNKSDWNVTYGTPCFWHYTLLSKLNLNESEFYPKKIFNICPLKREKLSGNFSSLYEDLIKLFNYYEKLSTGYILGQYNEQTFDIQFKKHLLSDRIIFNWLDDFGWEHLFPHYSKVIKDWNNHEKPFEYLKQRINNSCIDYTPLKNTK